MAAIIDARERVSKRPEAAADRIMAVGLPLGVVAGNETRLEAFARIACGDKEVGFAERNDFDPAAARTFCGTKDAHA